MKKAVLLASILAVAIAGQSFAAGAKKPTVQVTTEHDTIASAAFEMVDADGCVFADVWINASTAVQWQPGQRPSSFSYPLIGIHVYDSCNSIEHVFAETDTPGDFQFTFDPLMRKARLVGTVSVSDSLAGEVYPAQFDVSWVADGPVQKDATTSVTKGDGTVTTLTTVTKKRHAVATGVVTSPGNIFFHLSGNLIQNPSYDGGLETDDLITTTITRP